MRYELNYRLRGGQEWTQWHWDRFLSSTSVVLCQYHSTNSPHSSSSLICLYGDKRVKPGNLPKSNVLSEIDINEQKRILIPPRRLRKFFFSTSTLPVGPSQPATLWISRLVSKVGKTAGG